VRTILLVVSALVTAVPAAGQSFGASIAGVVTDVSGARVPDATVSITHEQNGRARVLVSGRLGEYWALALLPGDYTLSATRKGFASVTRRITLSIGAEATLNFTLPVAGVENRTSVVAEVPLVEVRRSQPSSTVTKDDVDRLPVLDRNFLVLAQLLPGSGPLNSTIGRFAVTKFGGPADQRSGYTTVVDGGAIDDAQWGSPTINIGQDAVQEFRVFRSQFDAEYGHALNAVVTVTTRSGTNLYKGSLFYFGRDDALNARNFFATDKPPFDEQRIGLSIGGPFVRDRSHFFGAYERDNVDNVRIISLPPTNPLAATENGTFPAASDNQTLATRIDHRWRSAHSLSVRYGLDAQLLRRAQAGGTSDSSQVDIRNRSHRLVFEDTWIPGQTTANAFRVYVLRHTLGTTPRTADVGIIRPAGTTGQTNTDSQVLSRTRLTITDALYRHTAQHDFKLGGEVSFGTHDNDSHVLENGVFRFTTDAAFNASASGTWPREFNQQEPTVVTYRSRELALFLQDDWQVSSRFRINAGLRYDIDFNLRLNELYEALLDDPAWTGLDQFVGKDRGTDTNNVQPRIGGTWDARGNGQLVVRGGWGVYVSRNRPWYQLRSLSQFASHPVRVTDLACLRFYPNISAVLGARQADGSYACGLARQLGTVIPDDFVHAYALNTTAGVGWQLGPFTALDLDYVHSAATHQTGTTDRNLPPSGPISDTNPRPVAQFGQVLMLENFSRSWYDALETQLRARFHANGSMRVSYALSRSYLDGVDFFLTTRGTQRTPRERGYNPSDQRHNLTVAGTVGLPWSLELSGVLTLVSGSPIKVQAGEDLDGDTTVTGDLPPGIPITVGRDHVDESLAAINEYRATKGLQPIDRSLLALDPYRTLDVRIAKPVRLGRQRLDVLVEAFNLTNHVNFRTNANANMNTASFLQRRAARDARQIQWGVRWLF
jgi:carboxypeptidase family protein